MASRQERSTELHHIGVTVAQALKHASLAARAIGETALADKLAAWKLHVERNVRRRCDQLDAAGPVRHHVARKAPVGTKAWAEHVAALRAEHAPRAKPPLRLRLAMDATQRLREEARRAG